MSTRERAVEIHSAQTVLYLGGESSFGYIRKEEGRLGLGKMFTKKENFGAFRENSVFIREKRADRKDVGVGGIEIKALVLRGKFLLRI